MSTCAECVHSELQCPPVVRCNLKGVFRYLDSEACSDFEHIEEMDKNKSKEKKEIS